MYVYKGYFSRTAVQKSELQGNPLCDRDLFKKEKKDKQTNKKNEEENNSTLKYVMCLHVSKHCESENYMKIHANANCK